MTNRMGPWGKRNEAEEGLVQRKRLDGAPWLHVSLQNIPRRALPVQTAAEGR